MKTLVLALLFLPSISMADCYVWTDGSKIEVIKASGFIPDGVVQICPKDDQGKDVEHGDDLVAREVPGDDEDAPPKTRYFFDKDKRDARLVREEERRQAKEAKNRERQQRRDRIVAGCSGLQGVLKDMCEHISGQ